MTQLEEYLERREELQRRLKEAMTCHAKDLPPEQRREVVRRRGMYFEMLEDLDVQIRAIDPHALTPKKQAVKKSVMSLNAQTDTGKEYGAFLAAEDGAEQERRREDAEKSRERQAALVIAAKHLTPRQAEALELRYNAGYSLDKIASEMGVSVNTAHRTIKRAEERLRDWAAICDAVRQCTVSAEVFMFDEFIELAPHAFPENVKEIVLTLYEAEPSRFQTVAALASACGRNYVQTSRQLGWVKELCELYGIPPDACHPLVRNSGSRFYRPERAFGEFNGFRKSSYSCRYRHDDAEKNFAARREEIRHRTVEDAVAAKIKTAYGAEDVPAELIGEGLRLFEGGRLDLARQRIDEGKTISACATAYKDGRTPKRVRSVIEGAALYAYFQYDVQRIFEGREAWDILFSRWECFPGKLGEVLRLLLDSPEIRSAAQLAARRNVASTNAQRDLKKLAWYAQWWGVPAAALPAPVQRYMDSGIDITRTPNTFRRAVSYRGSKKLC